MAVWLVACTGNLPSTGSSPSSQPSAGHATISIAPNPSPTASTPSAGFDPQHIASVLGPAVGTVIVNTRGGGGEGSGFVVAHDKGVSYMLTNNHVLDAAIKVQVLMPSGSHYQAVVQGTDPQGDIAVLRLNDPNLALASFGDSTKVTVGQPVVAIGSPLGNSGSISSGIISAIHRTITAGGNIAGPSETLPDVLQTDTSINPGNSGGPLADANGLVIGVNTAGSSNANGIGFAIPSLLAKRIANDLIAGRKPGHPYVGIKYMTEEDALASGTTFQGYGVIVQQVCPGTPADRAGLRSDDVIEKVGGTTLNNGQTLGGVLQVHSPGDQLKVTVLRAGSTTDLQLTLSDRPDQPSC